MATLSAYLPAEDAVGVYAVLDEYACRAKASGDERSMDAVAVMPWSIWCWVRSARLRQSVHQRNPESHRQEAGQPVRWCPRWLPCRGGHRAGWLPL